MTLSRKLSLMKAKKNMTTEALSALSGVPRGTLNKLLNGQTQNPTVGTLKALSRALVAAALMGFAMHMDCFGFWMGDALAGFMPLLIGGAFYLSGKWREGAA